MMKNSLYSKLIGAYFVVIFLSFVILAVMLSAWFERNYYSEKTQALLSQREVLSDLKESYDRGTIDSIKLTEELATLDKFMGARVWIVDRYTFIIACSNPQESDLIGNWITSDEIYNVLNKGSKVAKEGVFKDKLQTPMLTVAFPLVANDTVIGAAVINSPMLEINNALKRVYLFIWLSATFSMVIMIFTIYFLSRRIIIKPLYEINKTARMISNGEFEKRVDISSKDEIGQLAESFNYMADTLQNLENLRREFVANISHELRSPITSIRGFIQGILDGTIPEDKHKYYLKIAMEESKRLTRLISDVLDLSRLESGEFSLKMATFDINELIRINIIRFENEIENKKLNVDVTLSGDELNVKGDRDRIGQVLSNLIDNAIKFTRESGGIGISTTVEGKNVIVSVSDTGMGIPEDELKLIWDRFHMVDKSRTTKKGTGLGLSIVRQIINQHGEKIWVKSKEGEGTTFTFTLKLDQRI